MGLNVLFFWWVRVLGVFILATKIGCVLAANEQVLDVQILYVEQRVERPPVLSNLVSWPDDEGIQGARLAGTLWSKSVSLMLG